MEQFLKARQGPFTLDDMALLARSLTPWQIVKLNQYLPQAAIDQWRIALAMMAAFPNLHVKISGLGMYSNGITFPQARQIIRDVIQIFGVERTIYGSNFPLEKLHASYANVLGVYRAVLSEYTELEQRAVLHENAMKFYRL